MDYNPFACSNILFIKLICLLGEELLNENDIGEFPEHSKLLETAKTLLEKLIMEHPFRVSAVYALLIMICILEFMGFGKKNEHLEDNHFEEFTYICKSRHYI